MKIYDLNQALTAIAVVVVIIIGLKSLSDRIFSDRAEPVTPYMEQILAEADSNPPPAEGATGAETGTNEQKGESLQPHDIAGRIASVDPAIAESQVGICKACHTFDKGGRTLMGPNLWGVVGRAKAGVAGFAYSPAFSGLGGEWSYEDLDKFLESPSSFAKGTKMAFAGAKKTEQRAAIIAYLRQQADNPAPLPAE